MFYNPQHKLSSFITRFVAMALMLLALLLAGCGGSSSNDAGPAMEGSRATKTISSRATGSDYPLSIYLPPASAGPRSGLPVMVVLDGESWFETLVGIAEFTRTHVIIVAIHTAGMRSRDFVPVNACSPIGGGHAAYFDFIRQELLPYIEGNIGGNPKLRTLFGHSHGGSFVFYALFSEAAGQHSFRSYLASDSSISCMPAVVDEWVQAYAVAYRELPVRLHISYASQGNFAANLVFSSTLAQLQLGQLALANQAYSGTHNSIVPQVLADGLAFAYAGSP